MSAQTVKLNVAATAKEARALLFEPAERASAKAAIVICTDVYGIDKDAIQARSKELASLGYVVVLPDCLEENPFDQSSPSNYPCADGCTPKPGDFVSSLYVWWSRHDPLGEHVQGVLKSSVELCKSSYGFSEHQVIIVGVCFGGKALLGSLKESWGSNLLGAIAVHGSRMEAADMVGIVRPITMIWAGEDALFDGVEFLTDVKAVTKQELAKGSALCGAVGNYNYYFVGGENHGFWTASPEKTPTIADVNGQISSFITRNLAQVQ